MAQIFVIRTLAVRDNEAKGNTLRRCCIVQKSVTTRLSVEARVLERSKRVQERSHSKEADPRLVRMIRNYGAAFHFLFISELTLGNGTTRKRGSFHCKYSFRRIFARVWSVK